ncbi:MAG: S8 family serine peptidase [Hamadaea sp.]|uniref:S8 family serine peptidase n=1 Tax=Hamadaea sp. TaxID=2024425 RepID=UPI001810943A|nr:S8 family serine peptidase [Hamadaea sp.]NUR70184.1 S8 family serine peptidase [Hamadaea sp.]NUT24149.1 S8 family serine peptidase [Hamadaea sp.]
MRSTPPRSLAVAVSAVLAFGGLSAYAPTGSAAAPDPLRRVIVTLDGAAAATAAPAGSLRNARGTGADQVGQARRALSDRQHSFLDAARGKGVHPKAEHQFTLLVNAVAMTVPASEVATLAKLPGVTGVYDNLPVRAYTDVSVPLIGATDVWQQPDPSGTPATGTGVTVAVIDSGVDYSHPDLGGGFGPGHKVVGGYDYVNDDADPMDDNGHGTHVAGIIAGKAAAPGGITGVAPGARLLAYKVMNDQGFGETEDIVAAIEAASDPANPNRADVINMSLGGYADGLDPLGLAASAASAAGIVVVAAAGNDGPGAMSVGSPAAADGVIAVGASVSNLRQPVVYRDGAKVQTYRGQISANPAASPVSAPVVSIGYGTPEEIDAAGDLHGKIALLNGHVAHDFNDLWQEQIDLAKDLEKRGAIALLGGQDAGGGPVFAATSGVPATASTGKIAARLGVTESGDLYRMDSIVVLGMDETQYPELAALLAQGPLTLQIRSEDATDQIASFSSRGPSLRWGLKPDIVAPGYEIRSTVPTSMFGPGQYRLSGTSMAAPHVAGAAALLRQLHPDESASQLSASLIGSAKPLAESPTTVGAGRLDVAAAARSVLSATPSTLSYGLADLSAGTVGGTRSVALHNESAKAVSVRLTASSRDVSVKPDQVTVPAGGTATVTVTLKAKRPTADTEISGYVTATSSASRVTIPYLLVVHPLVVQASPDPSDGHTTVWVQSWTGLTAPPVITVDRPRGRSYTVSTRQNPSGGYLATLDESADGAYAVTAQATAVSGQRLIGWGGFEVTPESTRGAAWKPIGPYSGGGFLATGPSGSGILATENTTSPWVTGDQGATWTQSARLPISGAGGLLEPVADANNPDRMWYAVNDPMSGGRILRTDDRGKTWEALPLPPNGWIGQLTADPQTKVLVALVGDSQLQVSWDGGDSWTAYDTGVAEPVTKIGLSQGDLYLGTTGGVWKRPGIAGAAVNVYANTRYVSQLVADDGMVAVLVGQTGVVGSHDGGQTWTTLYAKSFGPYELRQSGGDLYVITFTGDGLIGHDHGRTWERIAPPSRASIDRDYDRWGQSTVVTNTAGVYTLGSDGYRRLGVQSASVTDLAVAGSDLIAGTGSGIYRTAIPAASPEWGAADGEGYVGAEVPLVAVSPQDPKIVWKVRTNAFGGFDVDRSGDGGVTWETKGHQEGIPLALLVHPADPDRVSVSWGRIDAVATFSTVDGGQTWKNLYQDRYATALAGDPAKPNRMWYGTPEGLYRSDDGGVTSTKVLDGQVNAISFDGRRMVVGGDTLRVSTDGGTTFRAGDAGPLDLWVSDIVQVNGVYYAATTSYSAYGVLKGGRGVLRSTDGGRTWHNVSNALQNLDVLSLAASADGQWLFAGTRNGGVHRLALR